MTGNGAVLDFCGSFPDRDGIWDLTARVFKDTSVLRAAYAALRPWVGNQLFFQHSAGLNEQATVNGFVRHAHTLVAGILGRQPSRNLFRRPVQQQFTRNDLSQLLLGRKQAPLWTQGQVPGSLIRFMGAIFRTATMPGHFPTHRRRGAFQKLGDLTKRCTGSEPSRNVLSLNRCEYAP